MSNKILNAKPNNFPKGNYNQWNRLYFHPCSPLLLKPVLTKKGSVQCQFVRVKRLSWLTYSRVNHHFTHGKDSLTKHLYRHVSSWDWWVTLKLQCRPLAHRCHSIRACWILQVVGVHTDPNIKILQPFIMVKAINDRDVWGRKNTKSKSFILLSKG